MWQYLYTPDLDNNMTWFLHNSAGLPAFLTVYNVSAIPLSSKLYRPPTMAILFGIWIIVQKFLSSHRLTDQTRCIWVPHAMWTVGLNNFSFILSKCSKTQFGIAWCKLFPRVSQKTQLFYDYFCKLTNCALGPPKHLGQIPTNWFFFCTKTYHT